MLSITNISADQAGRYYSQDNYYLKTRAGWHGRGAGALGLSGEVGGVEFLNLLNGHGPGGAELVGAANGRHRAGVDLTFSAPKGVSILSEVAGDERVREAHERAVLTALDYAERSFAQARETRDGVTSRVDTGNLVVAAFQHNVSRELDPQLHTHALVMNMTLREDGMWRALTNEELYASKMLLGQIYRNELGAELKRLGYAVEVTDGRKGLFDVRGVERDLTNRFSRRSGQIEEKAMALKASGLYPNAGEQKLREIATLGSRAAKKEVDMNTVIEAWQERLKEHGYTIEGLREKAFLEGRKDPGKEKHTRDGLDAAIRGLETMTAVWSKREMLREAMKIEAGSLRVSEAERRIEGLVKGRRLTLLDDDRYTTREAIRTEMRIVETVEKRRDSLQGIERGRVEAQIDSRAAFLNEGQRGAVVHVTTSRDGVVGIQGYAGSGKTTMLRVAREVWEGEGFTVRGMGFTGKAAEALEQEAGIEASTIHAFRGGGNTDKEVWVIDEASMVGNRQMLEILDKARDLRARVVLVGDVKQLQPIEAGRAFHVLQERGFLRTVRVTDILRQKDRLLKEAVLAVTVENNPSKAASILDQGGSVREVPERMERLREIADDYLSRDRRERLNTIIVTSQNRDRREINALVREGLRDRGEIAAEDKVHTVAIPKSLSGMDRLHAFNYGIGDEVVFYASSKSIGVARGEKGVVRDTRDNRLTVDIGIRNVSFDPGRHQKFHAYERRDRGFAAGDQVVFLKNDRALNVKNGTVGTVLEVEDGGLKVITERGIKEVDLGRYNHIDHGYALTVHKSQGQTVDRVIVNIDTTQERTNNANSFYVAISRARAGVTVYTDSRKGLPEAVGRWQEKESTLDYIERGVGIERHETELAMDQAKGNDRSERELER